MHSFIIQKHAFLEAQESVTLSTFFHKKLRNGFFGGEGFILQKLGGSGIAFLEIDGDIVENAWRTVKYCKWIRVILPVSMKP